MERDLDRAQAQNALEQLSHWQTARSKFVDFLAPADSAAALDLCCGTGSISFMLADRVKSVVGVDDSPDCLAVARGRPRRSGAAPAFQELTLGVLPFEAQSFDLVVGSHALLEGIRLEPLAAEVWRVVRPGATFGALIASRRFTPENLTRFISQHNLSHDQSKALHRIHRGSSAAVLPERDLETVLLGNGWRRLRTIELLDGLILGMKAIR